MKAVILGNTKMNYSWFVQTYRQGLQKNGVEVFGIDYKTNNLFIIKQQLLDLKPEMVFTHLTFHAHINPIDSVLQMYRDVHKKVGTIFCHTCNDARNVDRYVGSVEGAYQIAFVGSYPLASNCQSFWNIPVYYMPYSSLCYDSMADRDPGLAYQNPVFTGSPNAHRTGWADNRAKFIADLQSIMPIEIFKTQSAGDLRNKSHVLSASARCILGLCVGYEIPGYIDVRPFQYLGSGACMIMRTYPNTEHIIPSDLYYPIDGYGKADVYWVKKFYEDILKTDNSQMRKRAFDYIQAYHSCKVRMAEVLQCIDTL